MATAISSPIVSGGHVVTRASAFHQRSQAWAPVPRAKSKIQRSNFQLATVRSQLTQPTTPPSPIQKGALGAVQELVNGRAAMVGIVAAFIAERSTDSPLQQLLADDTQRFSLALLAVLASALPPFFSSYPLYKRKFGPFTDHAEVANGRLAMVGIASLLAIEHFLGRALFTIV
eukprot:jgi/Mesvir1/6823/Mv09008-RA.1